MDKKNNAYYLGIDLCDTYAMVSFYQLNMEEPDTVSTIAGSENYRRMDICKISSNKCPSIEKKIYKDKEKRYNLQRQLEKNKMAV